MVELKRRNPPFGFPRIASIVSQTFGVEIDKNAVRRVLAKHYRQESGGNGPSWLTFLGQMKDSLCSLDLFRCESIHLKDHWVLVVMDPFTSRLIGFGVQVGVFRKSYNHIGHLRKNKLARVHAWLPKNRSPQHGQNGFFLFESVTPTNTRFLHREHNAIVDRIRFCQAIVISA